MSDIPTRWAIVECGWGEGKKHIYSLHEQDVEYFKTEEEARAEIARGIQDGAKMMALLEVKALFVPRAVPFDEVA